MSKRSNDDTYTPEKRVRLKQNQADEQETPIDEDAEWEAFQALIGDDTATNGINTEAEQVDAVPNIEIADDASSDDEDGLDLDATWDSDEQRLEERVAEQQQRRAVLDQIRRERDSKRQGARDGKAADTNPPAAVADGNNESSDEERGWFKRKM